MGVLLRSRMGVGNGEIWRPTVLPKNGGLGLSRRVIAAAYGRSPFRNAILKASSKHRMVRRVCGVATVALET